MTEDKIAALDLKQLRALLDNARRMTGEKAAHVASLAEAELARREAKKPSRPKPTSNWTKHGGTYAHAGDLYEYRVGDMVVATADPQPAAAPEPAVREVAGFEAIETLLVEAGALKQEAEGDGAG